MKRDSPHLYLVYDAYMHPRVRPGLYGNASIVGKTLLRDHALVFVRDGYDGIPTIRPCPGKSVPALVLDAQGGEDASLILAKGSCFWSQCTHIVKVGAKDVEATTYRLADDTLEAKEPSAGYAALMRSAYEIAGLDVSILDEAIAYTGQLIMQEAQALEENPPPTLDEKSGHVYEDGPEWGW